MSKGKRASSKAGSKKKPQTERRTKGGALRRAFRLLGRVIHRLRYVILAAALLVLLYLGVLYATLPNVEQALAEGVSPTDKTLIYDKNGTVLMSYGKFHHKPVPLSKISPHMIEALLATEDQRFYRHHGVDVIGVLRAIVKDVLAMELKEGGSSITQQLARTVFLSHERSLNRKIQETFVAFKLERELTKDEILELYLNHVYFGEGAYGVEAASQIYFGKPASRLNRAEAAVLAGLPQAPSYYNPFLHPERATERRNVVIDRLLDEEIITAPEAEALKKSPLTLNADGRSLSDADKAPFFNRLVMARVIGYLGLDEAEFWQKGLQIYTTLDYPAQQKAQKHLRTLSAKYGRTGKNQQGAVVSIDNTGAIVAYVGGRDFAQSQFDRVSLARRQAGSLFKVFVYTTAVNRGISPRTVYRDEPVAFGNWRPQNYNHGHEGYMTVARALARSNNVIAAKVGNQLGPAAVLATARNLGITINSDPNLSIVLGSADVTLMDMTAAFSVLANKGVYNQPYAVARVLDSHDQVLYQHLPLSRAVLNRLSRDTMVAMMRGVVRFGTGRGAAIKHPVAGKTGTSDDYRDAWFIGFTPDLTTGVWVGNDDNSPMRGITGGSLPAQVWRGYMGEYLADKPSRPFELAQSMPFSDRDFFDYNLAWLSPTEDPPFFEPWFDIGSSDGRPEGQDQEDEPDFFDRLGRKLKNWLKD